MRITTYRHLKTRGLGLLRSAVVVGVCGLVGFLLLRQSHAATYATSAEAENGTLSGNAVVLGDANASGGSAVKFGTAPPSSGKPDATNTGVPAGQTLTIVNGDQTYGSSFNGQTISNKDFRGFVTVTGANITFSNCFFRGRDAAGANHALIDTEGSSGTITIQDSEFFPSVPSATIDGLWLQNTNAYRINVHGSVDGMKADSNTLLQDSYVHDMSWFAHDPNQGGGETHNDGVQTFAGETNITLRHNNIDVSGTKDSSGNPTSNAGWQSSANNSLAENNWFDGGGCTLNFDHKSVGAPIANAVRNNRFGRHQFFTGCAILLSTQASLTQNTGNVWDDTDTPIPPPQQHD